MTHPMVTEEMRAALGRVINKYGLLDGVEDERHDEFLDEMISAVLPLIGEACAKVAEQQIERYIEGVSAIDVRMSFQRGPRWRDGPEIASAIRAATKENSRG